jgi:hypothetical protein
MVLISESPSESYLDSAVHKFDFQAYYKRNNIWPPMERKSCGEKRSCFRLDLNVRTLSLLRVLWTLSTL